MRLSGKVLGWVSLCFLLGFFATFPNVDKDQGKSLSNLIGWSGVALAADNHKDTGGSSTKDEAVSDPMESWNRVVFKFNDKVYFWAMKPAAKAYAAVFPQIFREGVRNASRNIEAPTRIVSCFLQGNLNAVGTETARLIINSSLGIGGFFDFAGTELNIAAHEQDLGLTMGYWGVSPGMYIVWPFIGPSNLRDSVGLAGEYFLDPITYLTWDEVWYVSMAPRAGTMFNDTSLRIGEYEDLVNAAVDPYAALRHAYSQYREKQIER